MTARLALLVGSLAIAGCRCGDGEPAGGPARPGPAAGTERPSPAPTQAAPEPAPTQAATPAPTQATQPAATKPAATVPDGPIPIDPYPAGTDEEAFLAAAGALPAWTAVRERSRLLGRQGNRGAAWGLLRRDPDGQLWLVDPIESAAVLGIRLAGAGGRALAADGGRAVAWGAWLADGSRWVWQVERLVTLPPAGAKQAALADPLPLPPLPGHLVAELPQPPEGAVPPSQLQKAGPILFVVVAPPAKPGDGWTIADQGGKTPPGALLVLPGEAAIYGGLDYLSRDERWPLEPGAWYAVSVAAPGRPRPGKPAAPSKPRPAGKPPGPGDLPVLRAAGPPVRVPPPAPPAGRAPKKAGAKVRDR